MKTDKKVQCTCSYLFLYPLLCPHHHCPRSRRLLEFYCTILCEQFVFKRPYPLVREDIIVFALELEATSLLQKHLMLCRFAICREICRRRFKKNKKNLRSATQCSNLKLILITTVQHTPVISLHKTKISPFGVSILVVCVNLSSKIFVIFGTGTFSVNVARTWRVFVVICTLYF